MSKTSTFYWLSALIFSTILFGSAGQTQGNDKLDAMIAKMREASEGTSLDLGKIDAFQNTFLESIQIDRPEFDSQGILGSTEFGSDEANVLLQKLGEGNDSWILAIQLPKTTLGTLIPLMSNSMANDIELLSPVLVFSKTNVELRAADLSPLARKFYGNIFDSENYRLRISDGVNLVTSAEVDSDSKLGRKMKMARIDIPQVVLHGVMLKNFDKDELDKAKEEGRLTEELIENSEFRAAIPGFEINTLPKNWTSGQASLVITGRPSVGIQFDLTMVSDGNRRDFEAQLSFSKTETGGNKIAIHATGKGDELWKDAMGIKGVTLQSVVVEISIDSQQKVGFGTRAQMQLGPRFVDVVGGAEFHAVTGAPLRSYFKGKMDRLTSGDLVAIANAATSSAGLAKINADNLPDFELRDLEIMFAPLGGSEDLGITAGYKFKGDLYVNGKKMAAADAVIDQTGDDRIVMIKAEIGDIDLGKLALKNAKADIKMSDTDSYYRMKGYVKVFDADRYAEVDFSATHMYFKIDDKLAGVYRSSLEYRADLGTNPTWDVKASFDNDLGDDVGQQLSTDIMDWADKNNRDLAKAQDTVRAAEGKVRQLDSQINQARREVENSRQRKVDSVSTAQRKVNDAQSSVDSLRNQAKSERQSQLSGLKRTRDSANSSMRSRKTASDKKYATYKSLKKKYNNTKNPITKAKLKAKMLKALAEYKYAKGKYNVAKTAYNAAKKAYDVASTNLNKVPVDADPRVLAAKGTLKTAEYALKGAKSSLQAIQNVPVDLDPKVAGLIGARKLAMTGLDQARKSLRSAQSVVQTSAKIGAWAARNGRNVLSIESIRFETRLSTMLTGSKVKLDVTARLAGEDKSVQISVDSSVLNSENLANVVKAELRRNLM